MHLACLLIRPAQAAAPSYCTESMLNSPKVTQDFSLGAGNMEGNKALFIYINYSHCNDSELVESRHRLTSNRRLLKQLDDQELKHGDKNC